VKFFVPGREYPRIGWCLTLLRDKPFEVWIVGPNIMGLAMSQSEIGVVGAAEGDFVTANLAAV
jgi:hypothetical protein